MKMNRILFFIRKPALKLLAKVPPLRKTAVAIASVFRFRPRSNPLSFRDKHLREIDMLFRRGERQKLEITALSSRPVDCMRIAIHLHLYYIDMAETFRKWLCSVPVEFDLFVSVPEGRGFDAARFADLPNVRSVTVEAAENRGRDVMPMINIFGPRLADFDVFLHIHTKKSPHDGVLSNWLNHLMKNLLSSKDYVLKILNLFDNYPELGILYPEPLNTFPYWSLTNQSNITEMKRLFELISLDFPQGEKYIDFPAGTMFWARGKALTALLRSPVCGFPDELGQVDGTLAHAIERSLCLIASQAGYTSAQTDVKSGAIHIGPGIKNLDAYIAADENSAFSFLKGFKFASFDLFGTLAVTGFTSRGDFWNKVAEDSFPEFSKIREAAGDAVLHSGVTADINSVYMEFQKLSGLPYEDCEAIKQLEFDTLFDSCRPRTAVVRLLNKLLARNTAVIITEDTLWPGAYVNRILTQFGVQGKPELCLSGCLGCDKQSGGIFGYIKAGFNGCCFVHVGDDEIVDMHIPNALGIHTFHVMHPNDMARVIGLSDAEALPYRERMIEDPFCLMDILKERAS
jgi:hypothetical protein